MDVVFLSPAYPPEMRQYTRGLAEVGVRVWGIGDSRDIEGISRYLAGYLHVPRILDEEDVIARASDWLRGKNIERVLANWEVLVHLAARMRERWGIPGMSVDTVVGFRDKAVMKERLAAAGLRVPRSERVASVAACWEAAERIGYPLVLKPIAGAGSADTYVIRSKEEMEATVKRLGHVPELSCEEYIDGEELTYDTVCIDGVPSFESVTHYLPRALEGRSEEWISPASITVRDLSQPHIVAGTTLGRDALRVLGMGDGFTHMEWFYTPSGEAVFGEVGCRPGGACLVDQMNYTCDIDLFVEWARVACHRHFDAPTERKYNTAIVFKRAQGQGRISRIEGLDQFRHRYGQFICEDRISKIGDARRNWRQTLLSDGHIILRHPDWDEAKRMIFEAATDITLYAG
jgi:biotin carboxylase